MSTLKSSLAASSLVLLLSATLTGCLPGGSSSSSSGDTSGGGSTSPTTPTLTKPCDIEPRQSGETVEMVIGVGYLVANNDSLTVTSTDPAEVRICFLFNEADAEQQRQTELLEGSAQLNYSNN